MKFNFKDVKFSDFKKQEEELLKVYKLYLEAMKIMNYQHDITIMREIVTSLNPEFHKLCRYIRNPQYASISSELDEELLKLKCGIYFIPFSKGLMQIDILPDNYYLRDAQTEKFITEIPSTILSEIITKVKAIDQKQQMEEKEAEKQNVKEEINRLTRKLKMLEN